MKKLITISTTLLLLMSCFAGCGQKEKEEVEIPENYLYTEIGLDGEIRYVTAPPTEPAVTMGETTEPQPVVIDVFEGVDYSLVFTDTEVYPDGLSIQIDLDNSPFFGKIDYAINVLSAETDSFTFEIVADTDGSAEYLETNNYIVEQNTKTYEMGLDGIRTYLLSSEYLANGNQEILLNGIQEALKEEIGSETYGELWKLCAYLPKEGVQYINENGTNVYSFMGDGHSGGSGGILYTDYSCDKYRLCAIYKTDNGYYVGNAEPVFKDGVIDETATVYNIMTYSEPNNYFSSTPLFPDESAIQAEIEAYHKRYGMEDGFTIEELPLS